MVESTQENIILRGKKMTKEEKEEFEEYAMMEESERIEKYKSLIRNKYIEELYPEKVDDWCIFAYSSKIQTGANKFENVSLNNSGEVKTWTKETKNVQVNGPLKSSYYQYSTSNTGSRIEAGQKKERKPWERDETTGLEVIADRRPSDDERVTSDEYNYGYTSNKTSKLYNQPTTGSYYKREVTYKRTGNVAPIQKREIKEKKVEYLREFKDDKKSFA